MASLLEVRNLSVSYGGVRAVSEASLTVQEDEIVTILGSNGAGKSSLLNAIVGMTRPNGGEVVYNGISITGLPTYRITAQGIAIVPEGRHVFPQMTVMENLQLGAWGLTDRKAIAAKHMIVTFPLFLGCNRQLHWMRG